MARYSGKGGRVYLSTTGTGNAAEIALASWVLNMNAEMVDVSQFGDLNKQSVAGLPNLAGKLSGFWDNTIDTLYDASRSDDGVKMYLYPTNQVPAKYFYGPAGLSLDSIDVALDGAIKIEASFGARGDWGQY